jgi:hypothetical protein
MLSIGTHLSSIADETFNTNLSLQPKLGRNQKNKQRQKERLKRLKKELYRGWVQLDHKLRGLVLQNNP